MTDDDLSLGPGTTLALAANLAELNKQLTLMHEDNVIQRAILRQLVNPYSDGGIHEDWKYQTDPDATLAEQAKNHEIARSSRKPEYGLLFGVTITFYGIGGKSCRGFVQLDGARLEFETLQALQDKGITEPLTVGWYISSWDNAAQRYGVSWRSNVPMPYSRMYRVAISNDSVVTATNDGDVTYDLHATRFVKDVVDEKIW